MAVVPSSDAAPVAIAAAGAAGAALWLLLIFGLPASWKAFHGEITWSPSLQRVLGLIGLILGYLILGGVAPFIVNATEVKEAIGYGLGWQGVLGQFVRPSGRDGSRQAEGSAASAELEAEAAKSG
jgi:hypothetical protein